MPTTACATYAFPGLPWACSRAHARAGLEAWGATVGPELEAGTLSFENQRDGFTVSGEAHFTFGALSDVRMVYHCSDEGLEASSFFGRLCGAYQSLHGPYETVMMPSGIIREWPSDERGSLRMTLDVETEEIVILYHSGVAD